MALTQQPSKWARPSPTIRVGVLGLLAAFLLALPLALAARAEAYIYWANVQSLPGELFRDRPRRTSTDPASTRASSPAPAALGGIAVDARHIYWTNSVACRTTPDRRASAGDRHDIDRAAPTSTVPTPATSSSGRPQQRARGRRLAPATSTGQGPELDRPRQARRHRRHPELHHAAPVRRRLNRGRRRRRRQPRLLDAAARPTRARSAAPTSTARASTELHHRRRTARSASRSTGTTSTGPNRQRERRSAAPSSTARDVDHSFITARSRRGRRRGRRRARLLGRDF